MDVCLSKGTIPVKSMFFDQFRPLPPFQGNYFVFEIYSCRYFKSSSE